MAVVKWYLNGVEQTTKPLPSCSVTDNISDYMSQFNCTLPNPIGVNKGTISNNDTIKIELYDFNTTSWVVAIEGFVSKFTEDDRLQFTGQDWTGRTYQRTISENYKHKEISWIVKDIADKMLPEFTYTNVSNTGTDTEMNTQTSTDGTVTLNGANQKLAQKFQPTQSNVIKVEVDVQNNSSGEADFELRANNTGNPSTYDVLQTVSNVTLANGYNEVFLTRKGLDTSLYYWIVVTWKAGSFDLSTNGSGSSGRVSKSTASPESWASQTQDDLKFKTYYTDGKILESFKCVGKKVADAYRELADTVGEDQWIFYIDDSEDIHFKEESFASTGKQYNETNIFKASIKEEGKKVRNRVIVRGGEKLTQNVTTPYVGNGTQKLYTISSGTPVELKQVTVNSVVTTSYTADLSRNLIEFDTAPTNGHAIAILHDKRTSVIAEADNPTSIAANGLCIHEKQDKNIVSNDRAQEIADALLALWGDPRNSIVVEVFLDPSLVAGKTVEVRYSHIGIDSYTEYVISKVTHSINRGKLMTKMELINSDIASVPEALKELKAIVNEIQMQQTDEDAPVTKLITMTDVGVATTDLTVELGYITDSFVLGHDDNGIIGVDGQILSNGDDQGDWSNSGFSAKSENTDSDYCRTIDKSIKCDWTSTGTATLTNTQTIGDLSDATGESSGTPSKGTIGLHAYLPASSEISDVKLRIGSSASDYIECNAYYLTDPDFGLEAKLSTNDGWNYLRFDLDNPDSTSGTPDWTDVDYMRLEITKVSSTGTVYLDYLTISESNVIGMNGLGDRTITRTFVT